MIAQRLDRLGNAGLAQHSHCHWKPVQLLEQREQFRGRERPAGPLALPQLHRDRGHIQPVAPAPLRLLMLLCVSARPSLCVRSSLWLLLAGLVLLALGVLLQHPAAPFHHRRRTASAEAQ